MELSNKAAYLQGLVDGLGVDESTKEGKIIKAMSALLAEMAEALEGMDEDLSRAYDQINDLSDELEDLEAALYEDEEDDDDEDDDDQNEYDFGSETLYEVKCPTCGEVITIDEEMLDEGATTCPNCGEELEFDMEDEDSEEDE